ncbi:33243_t:CDS:1, partial [Gigaspora margarita]
LRKRHKKHSKKLTYEMLANNDSRGIATIVNDDYSETIVITEVDSKLKL